MSVANTAWHVSFSSFCGLKNGFRTSSEWPASEETGIRVFALGNSVEKTRGDQAPDVIRRRVHGTTPVSSPFHCPKHVPQKALTVLTLPVLTPHNPYSTQYTPCVIEHLRCACWVNNSDTALLHTCFQPLAKPQRVNLRRRAVYTNDFHNAIFCPPQPLRAVHIFFPWPVVICKLCAASSIFKPVFA